VKTLPSHSEERSLFWPLQLGGWGLFGAGMFAAGVTHWPLAYTAVVKTSLTVFGFASSLALRAAYRELARRGVPVPARVAAAIPLAYGAAGLWMAPHNFAVAAYSAPTHAAAALAAFPDFANTIYFFFVLSAGARCTSGSRPTGTSRASANDCSAPKRAPTRRGSGPSVSSCSPTSSSTR